VAPGARLLSDIVEVAAADRKTLDSLFSAPRPLSPGVDMVLEGLAGAAFVDDSTAPNAALLTLAGYAYFGGDASSNGAGSLIGLLGERRWLIVGDQRWLTRVKSQIAGTAPLHRMMFSRDDLDIKSLRQQVRGVSDGTEIVATDLDITRRMITEVEDDLIGIFPTPEAFAVSGFGYVAIRDGMVICGATSAMRSVNAIEIQITTAESAQRQGLATAVSAALIVHCLERGIEPHWSTTNEPSRGLAEKLGYVMHGSHETLFRAS